VTLGAFENRAVGTALPTLVDEFGAIGSFGLANAAPVASYVVSLAISGLWADRRGPVPVLRAGALMFAVAQLVIGTAASMPMVIGGRLLSGLAEGLIDIGLMVMVARALPAELRPRMFSLFAAMWILPSVFGPVLSGLVTEQFGWRWVFLGALALLVPTWLLLRPAIRSEHRPVSTAEEDGGEPDRTGPASTRSVAIWAVAAAAAVFALNLAGEHLAEDAVIAALVIAVAVVVLVLSATRLLPDGTFRARRGLPTVVGLRGIIGAAFAGTGAYLPLLLTVVHGFPPSAAGISLSITGAMWAFGSWLQGRDHSLARVSVLRAGLTVMASGLAVTTTLAWTDLPVGVGLAGWAVAGIGMGLSSPTLSVLVLDLSGRHNQGRNSSAAQMAGSMSIATAFAVSGALIAFAAPAPGRAEFTLILGAGAVIAVVARLIAGRVIASAEE
jgi:MFS family permease